MINVTRIFLNEEEWNRTNSSIGVLWTKIRCCSKHTFTSSSKKPFKQIQCRTLHQWPQWSLQAYNLIKQPSKVLCSSQAQLSLPPPQIWELVYMEYLHACKYIFISVKRYLQACDSDFSIKVVWKLPQYFHTKENKSKSHFGMLRPGKPLPKRTKKQN